MDIYQQKSRWKIYLAIAGVVIIAISMFYTNYLVDKLRIEEHKKIELWKSAFEEIQTSPYDSDVTFYQEVLMSNTTIPMILVDEKGDIYEGHNLRDTSLAFLTKKLNKLKNSGLDPIKGSGYWSEIYYADSSILNLLRYLPILQFFLISAFILAGYLSFSSARRGEQNRVWAGMAKETAHQLGTPISAIIGWIEALKDEHEQDDNTLEILGELENDVSRLELITDRFSKIGSEPVLTKTDIAPHILSIRDYMARRSPRKVIFDFPEATEVIHANINAPLFNWVLENLLRNSIDSMGSVGQIKLTIDRTKDWVEINLSDTGKGISPSKLKQVFQPGYTTKKRGWGLGLSLAKRIIEQYHKGKIFVKESKIDKGTTFTIQLPK